MCLICVFMLCEDAGRLESENKPRHRVPDEHKYFIQELPEHHFFVLCLLTRYGLVQFSANQFHAEGRTSRVHQPTWCALRCSAELEICKAHIIFRIPRTNVRRNKYSSVIPQIYIPDTRYTPYFIPLAFWLYRIVQTIQQQLIYAHVYVERFVLYRSTMVFHIGYKIDDS